jgi:peptide/nickel transport system substrate-binding protein
MKKTSARWLIAGIAMATLASCSSATSGGDDATASEDGDRLVVASQGEPGTLDALLADDPAMVLATWSVNEGLVYFSPDGELQPILAAELPQMVEGDPTRWRVKLREGIEFSNGEPFNAEAVKANIDHILDPEFGSEIVSEFGTMSGAEVVDEYTVDILTEQPDPVFDNRLTLLRLAAPKAMLEPDYGEHPIGTGPYVFDTWEKGRFLTLEANEDYWGDAPAIPEVEIRFIPDLGTRFSALQAGEVDLAQAIPPDRVDEVEQVLESPNYISTGIFRFRLDSPPVSDVRFRQALNYAVNKQQLVDSLFGYGYQVAPCQSVDSASYGFNPDLEAYPYDPDKARELLAQVDIPEGWTLELDAHSPGLTPRESEIVQAVAADIAAVGVPVKAVMNPSDVWFDKLLAAGRGSEGGDPNAVDALFATGDNPWNDATRAISIYLDRDGSVSTVGTAYPELDEMVEKATTELDDDLRQQYLNDVTELACDDAFFLWTFQFKDLWGASERVQYEPGLGELIRFDFGRVTFADE